MFISKTLLLEAYWKMNMIQHLLSCKRPHMAMRKGVFYHAKGHLWKEAKSRLQYLYECIFTCIFNVTLISLFASRWQAVIDTERQKNGSSAV